MNVFPKNSEIENNQRTFDKFRYFSRRNPSPPVASNGVRLAKKFDFKISSYEGRVYESVDDRILSLIILQQSTEKRNSGG